MQRLSRTLIHLNVATREHHGAADAPWLDLMVPAVERHAYMRQLIHVYSFEAPLEAAFHYTPGLATLVDLRVRKRAGLIVRDLMHLGLGPARIAGLDQRFATFSSPAEALGWMYVVERATLLHNAVRRYLLQHLPDVTSAWSYLAAYDGVAAARWSDLGSALDAIASEPDVKRQILRAARKGFVALHEWHQDSLGLRSVGT
jgi:heme oxygenase